MAVSIGVRALVRGHRLHERLNNLIIMHSAIGVAGHFLHYGHLSLKPGDHFKCECSQIDNLAVKLPIFGPLHLAFLGKPSTDFYIIEFVDNANSVAPPGAQPITYSFRNVLTNLTATVFVEYYEGYRQWLFDKLGHPDGWSSVWQFARVVRNAMSHGGKISIQKSNALGVHWHNANYSYQDNGKEIFGYDIDSGDLIALKSAGAIIPH